MDAPLGLIGLMTAALQRFADGWRSWGPLAIVLGAALFAFTVVLVLMATGVGLWAGLTQPGNAQELPTAMLALFAAGGLVRSSPGPCVGNWSSLGWSASPCVSWMMTPPRA